MRHVKKTLNYSARCLVGQRVTLIASIAINPGHQWPQPPIQAINDHQLAAPTGDCGNSLDPAWVRPLNRYEDSLLDENCQAPSGDCGGSLTASPMRYLLNLPCPPVVRLEVDSDECRYNNHLCSAKGSLMHYLEKIEELQAFLFLPAVTYQYGHSEQGSALWRVQSTIPMVLHSNPYTPF